MDMFGRVNALVMLAIAMINLLAADAASAEQDSRPNFIIIFTDDQGYQDLGVFGATKIRTPNIDRMAKQGMRFTDFYSAASVCTPSRAALLTGCYPERVGNMRVHFPRHQTGLNPAETTIAKMLKQAGYATACIGKWHLGHLKEFLPTSHGFDSYYGIPYSNDMTIAKDMLLSDDLLLREGVTRQTLWQPKKNHVPLLRDEKVIEYPANQATLTKRYTREAIAFVDRNRDKPFFLYLPHTMPHVPLYASPAFEGKSESGLYGDCIEEIDWSVGEIIKALKRNGIDKNTLIIYCSDNGPWNFKANATDKVKGNKNRRTGGSALPLRGYKFQHWEGGMREPTVMWWPGRIPAGTVCGEVAGTIDLLPTIAALSGAKLPSKKIDGKSIVPLLEARKGATSPHAAYFYRTLGVRVGQWKLIRDRRSKDKKFGLFDLSKDISESTDVAADHPQVVTRLTALLAEHTAEIKKNARPIGRLVQSPD
jgi:arylsulfatase A